MNKNMQSVLQGVRAGRKNGVSNGQMYNETSNSLRTAAIKALSYVGLLLFVTLIVMVIIRDSHMFGG